jgi:ketosteroid isomerase-like protein
MAAPVPDYYEALDEHAYDRLETLLDPEFVHERPDRTLDGRERFVAFMRDERPQTETTHELDAVLEDGDTVAVEGRLLEASGDLLFMFADFHEIDSGTDRIQRLRTYTR